MIKTIQSILAEHGITLWGNCTIEDVGPLRDVRSRQKLPQNTASIIAMLFPYKTPLPKQHNVSRYAVAVDYHTLIQNRLTAVCARMEQVLAGYRFVSFVDNSPINEVRAAYQSGLGFLGKNGLLIHPVYGSFCFIGTIATDLPLAKTAQPLGRCIGCNKCIACCIGGALGEDGLNTARCLSFITQKKGELSPEEQALIQAGGLIWGCDICSDVCPMNKDAADSPFAEFYENLVAMVDSDKLEELCKTRAYGYRGSKVLKRNLCIIEQKSGHNKNNS